MRAAAVLGLATSVAGLVLIADTPVARACGCLSPPAVSEGAFAVNQQSEQIIFEVEPGWVTAHVLIKYAGDPSQFAWIVPVPEVPELGISPASAFALLDTATAPNVNVSVESLCPTSEWACQYHSQPSCGWDDDFGNGASASADAGAGGPGGGGPPVTVLDQQVVGDYETVTFRADEANVAVAWLRNNGFVVNQTTSIYMESYVQQNMVFVAAKLVPGAGVKAIKPLKLRYRAAYPTVPLILTAVAAEPHLTVTSFIYGDTQYRPLGHPLVSVDASRIARDTNGRTNYPMVLARTIDEAGGDGFIREYGGWPVQPDLNQNQPCCYGSYDTCGLANNGSCECPLAGFDSDCANVDTAALTEGMQFLGELAQKHTSLTRLTTRVSAEEMTFDPSFEPDFAAGGSGALFINANQKSLGACAGAVIDDAAFAAIDAKQSCAAMYCGPQGECVATAAGAACMCNPGHVAHRFTDLDGLPSVTCIPRAAPVDLRANGEDLPDACINKDCGDGTCLDRNGVAVCQCDNGAAATPGATVPRCESIVASTQTPGAEDYSDALSALEVCAPPPPTCGPGGWLAKTPYYRKGVDCGGTQPSPEATEPGPRPTCSGFFGNDFEFGGCGCSTPTSTPPVSLVVIGGMLGFIVLRRRPHRRGK